MTLQEVVKSGKKFRRPNFKPYMGQPTWLELGDYNTIIFSNTFEKWSPRAEDITATDWVLEETKREFTFKEIFDAVIRVSDQPYSLTEFESYLKIALGFEPKVENVHYCEGYFCRECRDVDQF